MSTVQVSNITDGTNSVETVYVARGSAKAWVNFDGTGTIAARDSLNLSSLTDNGTGSYTLNLSNAFDAVDFSISLQASDYITGSAPLDRYGAINGAPSVSSINMVTGASTTTARTLNDFVWSTVSVHGDLA